MIQNLSNDKILLESKIRHKKELMEAKTKEFNSHSCEARRLQRVVEALWIEINADQRKLENLENQQVKEPTPFKGIFDEFNKAFFPLIVFLFLLPCLSFSQAFVSFEGTNHGVGINAGYSYNHIQMSAGLNSPITRNALAPNIFYLSAGSKGNITKLLSFTPSIGIAKYHVTELIKNSHENDIRDINKTALLTALEIGKDFTLRNGNEGHYYIFYRHAGDSFFGAGLRIYIN